MIRSVHETNFFLTAFPSRTHEFSHFWWGPCFSSLLVVCVVLLCVFTFLVPCCDVRYYFHRISTETRCLVRLYLQLFVGGHYLCLFAHSGVQHILCCVFFYILFAFILRTQCCQFLSIVHVRYSLTFSFRHVCLILPVSLDCPVSLECPLVVAQLVFANIY